ncbi:primosomal protein DnaI [Fictibacillus aquaticus]|uniref:Primosomal protein DnaI n=1 Tax=Fictibacillus aquaticus TaxID=2021314 RepID=A0A235FA67_9BACL|nr:primosomal protein DnaI [Fictibacillus aquaticus]OYD58162.1 primosomal protein DnaI [Fictibacillus aquaticus]
MESIQDAMKQWQGSKNFQEQFDTLKNKVLNDKYVSEFLSLHPEVTENAAIKSLSSLYSFCNERKTCDACPGLEACPNMMQGYQPSLNLVRGTIEVTYGKCPLKLKEDRQKALTTLMKSYFIPQEILQASFERLYTVDSGRNEAIQHAVDFVKAVSSGLPAKGLYFHGKFGTGKTYLLGAIANSLAEKGVESLLVHTPEFLHEMKSSLNNGTFSQKMDMLKKVPVLMLDDIGAEHLTHWVRDEIIGVILQHRMMEKLPTLYSSNYTLDLLAEHLAFDQKGGMEKMKALRIMERIRHLSIPVFMGGEINYRL